MKTAIYIACATISLYFTITSRGLAQDVVVPKVMPPQLRPTDTIKLRVHPAPATQPALQHRLLPDLAEQAPGNAATLYLIADRLVPTHAELRHDVSNAEDLSLDQMRARQLEMQRTLDGLAPMLRYVDLAGYRRDAHWDWGGRELGISGSISYLNDLRFLARVVSIRTRYQLAVGRFDDAERSMRVGFSMARQLNDDPPLITGLVATGMTTLMLEKGVREWITRRDAPNLYWALTELPRPFVGRRAIQQWEAASLAFTDPRFALAIKGQLPADQWTFTIKEAVRLSRQRRQHGANVDIDTEFATLRASTYPRAKQYLMGTGMPPQQVNAMSIDEAVGRCLVHEYNVLTDDLWKTWELPVWQAVNQMEQTRQACATPEARANPFVQLGIPTDPSDRPQITFARLDRTIGALRMVEALRDYAARHNGHAPDSLDQVTELPLPIDVFTGSPFRYHLTGGGIAILDLPAPRDLPDMSPQRYELTFEN